jgi:hypothetical protein
MASCFKEYLACMRQCARLPGLADQMACAADCDLELAACIKDKLFMSSATEAVALSRSMRLGLAIPIDMVLSGDEFDSVGDDAGSRKGKK